MDNRYFRDGNDVRKKDKSYFGEKQIDWLITALKNSRAPLKLSLQVGRFLTKQRFLKITLIMKRRENITQAN